MTDYKALKTRYRNGEDWNRVKEGLTYAEIKELQRQLDCEKL
jgi:hypothetical protein